MKPQRPLGVILSAIALGLAAGLFLLLTLGSLATLGGAHLPAGATGSGPVPPQAFLTVVMLGTMLIYLALAAWSISTLVGLLRMRPWARISTMILAGCLVGFGLLSAVSMLGMRSLLASGSVPVPPNVDPALFHKAFVAVAVVSLLLAGLGIGWLVYFALRRTREAFALAQAEQNPPQTAYLAGQAPTNPAARAWPVPQTQPAPNPLTDFTVARPLAPPTPPSSGDDENS